MKMKEVWIRRRLKKQNNTNILQVSTNSMVVAGLWFFTTKYRASWDSFFAVKFPFDVYFQ